VKRRDGNIPMIAAVSVVYFEEIGSKACPDSTGPGRKICPIAITEHSEMARFLGISGSFGR
jgi:hypothetical protein